MIRLEPILLVGFPKDAEMTRAEISKTLTIAVEEMREDLRKPTRTWNEGPSFKTSRINTPTEIGVEIYLSGDSEGNKNFERVDDGTAAHDIVATDKKLSIPYAFRAKTIPGTLTSRQAFYSDRRSSHYKVRHPGIQARHFTKTVADMWDKKFPIAMEKAIDLIAKKLGG